MTKIKICGLKRTEDIELANKILPDYIGFMFWENSKRYIPVEKAAELKKMLDPHIKAVGVYVDEDPIKLANTANEGIIDIIQLHGEEDEEYISRLRGLTDKKIIKAFRIRSEADALAADKSSADAVLLDSGSGIGGTGKSFDRSLIKAVKRDYFLAGGLTPENVTEAISECSPYAVDVSSGVETDSLKDADKMTAFVMNVRKMIKGGKG